MINFPTLSFREVVEIHVTLGYTAEILSSYASEKDYPHIRLPWCIAIGGKKAQGFTFNYLVQEAIVLTASPMSYLWFFFFSIPFAGDSHRAKRQLFPGLQLSLCIQIFRGLMRMNKWGWIPTLWKYCWWDQIQPWEVAVHWLWTWLLALLCLLLYSLHSSPQDLSFYEYAVNKCLVYT